MGNPLSANPCSLAAVKSVMQSFKGDLNIPHSRQWSIVGDMDCLISCHIE